MSYRPKYNDSDNNKVDLPIDAETVAGHAVESSGVDSNTSTLPTTAQVKAYVDYLINILNNKTQGISYYAPDSQTEVSGNLDVSDTLYCADAYIGEDNVLTLLNARAKANDSTQTIIADKLVANYLNGPNDTMLIGNPNTENWMFKGDSLIMNSYGSHNIQFKDDNDIATLDMYFYDHEFEIQAIDPSTSEQTNLRIHSDSATLDRQPEAEWNLLTNKTWLVKTQYYSLSSEGVLGVVNNLDLSSFEITDINDALDFRTDYSVCLNILYNLAKALIINNSNCLGYSANVNVVKITENNLTLFVESIDSNTIQYRVKDTSDDDNPNTYRLRIAKSGNTYTKQESGDDRPKFALLPIYSFFK